MYPNGVGDGRGRYVAIFVHMMEGEHDDILNWPYAGRITLSVLDRNGQRDNDISHTLQAKPTLAAFQRPREAICPIGYGLIYFARIELFFGPQFVKKRWTVWKLIFHQNEKTKVNFWIFVEFLGTLDSGENVKKLYHASLLCQRLFTWFNVSLTTLRLTPAHSSHLNRKYSYVNIPL